MRYVAPRNRPGRPDSTLDRVRRLVHMEEAKREGERPFDPEAPREHYAGAHHFAVNGIDPKFKPYGSEPWLTPEGRNVYMFRKRTGQRVRFYDEDGNQVGPEQQNVAPAHAYAGSQGWKSGTERDIERGVNEWHFPNPDQYPGESGLRSEILDAMARTFFVMGWADAMEEAGERLYGELMDQAPETPSEAFEHAEEAARRIEAENGSTLGDLYLKMASMEPHGEKPTPFGFGYALAMMYVGSGVSWFDDHPGSDEDLRMPRYGEGLYVSRESL